MPSLAEWQRQAPSRFRQLVLSSQSPSPSAQLLPRLHTDASTPLPRPLFLHAVPYFPPRIPSRNGDLLSPGPPGPQSLSAPIPTPIYEPWPPPPACSYCPDNVPDTSPQPSWSKTKQLPICSGSYFWLRVFPPLKGLPPLVNYLGRHIRLTFKIVLLRELPRAPGARRL